MYDATNPYEVTQLTVREHPPLTIGNRTAIQTSVAFYVGDNGPFVLIYPGKANAAQITKDVTAKVNELRAMDDALRNLNSQTAPV